MTHLHFFRSINESLFNLSWSKVIVISLSVPSISFPIFFVVLHLGVFFDVIVAFVTRITWAVAIGTISELSHALPAEVIAALVARHVVTILGKKKNLVRSWVRSLKANKII